MKRARRAKQAKSAANPFEALEAAPVGTLAPGVGARGPSVEGPLLGVPVEEGVEGAEGEAGEEGEVGAG